MPMKTFNRINGYVAFLYLLIVYLSSRPVAGRAARYEPALGPFVWNALLGVFFACLVRVLQGIGHILVARGVGLRPIWTRLGKGHYFGVRRLFGQNFYFWLIPTITATVLGASSARWLRVRLGISYLARPAVSVAALAICLAIFGER